MEEQTAVLEIPARVRTLKKNEKVPDNEYYYGSTLSNGLAEVRFRENQVIQSMQAVMVAPGEPVGNVTIPRMLDSVQWYEKTISVDGDFHKIMYAYNAAPVLFPEYYYPMAIWNITQDHYLTQDNVPDWKKFPLVIDGQQISDSTGTPFSVFHFVLVNHNFEIVRLPDGTTDNDGLFQMSEPRLGEFIISRFEAIKTLGYNPVATPRARIGE